VESLGVEFTPGAKLLRRDAVINMKTAKGRSLGKAKARL
jgi:hypothetical protein